VIKLKLKLMLLYGNTYEEVNSNYDADRGIAIVKGRRWFRKGVETRFIVDQEDIFYPPVKGRKRKLPMVLVDRNIRKSIKPLNEIEIQDENGNTKKIKPILMAENPDPVMKARLDYMNEQSFWGALIMKVKTSPYVIVLSIFAGMGIYSFIRMMLWSFGFKLP